MAVNFVTARVEFPFPATFGFAHPKDNLMTNNELEEWLSRPTESVVNSLQRIDGDILILGAGGKMGPTLARMARRATSADRRIMAVSRFSSTTARKNLEQHGVDVIPCDLLNRHAVQQLPDAPNIIFMAGQKFGTSDAPEQTWMINSVLPALVAERFSLSRIVVFSTGCVYPLTSAATGGSVETDSLTPPGEYAYSCIARERVFSNYSRTAGTPTLLFRLNYAIDLRYGVLHDIAQKVWRGQPVDVSAGHVNVIWQGDANARALQCLELTASPPAILNVTGRECISVRWLAERFGDLLGKSPVFMGSSTECTWLSNASKSFELLGDVSVSLDAMLEATAAWIQSSGVSLGKPTHFEATHGKF